MEKLELLKKSAEQELKFPAGRLLANRLIHAASQPWRLLALWHAMDPEWHLRGALACGKRTNPRPSTWMTANNAGSLVAPRPTTPEPNPRGWRGSRKHSIWLTLNLFKAAHSNRNPNREKISFPRSVATARAVLFRKEIGDAADDSADFQLHRGARL